MDELILHFIGFLSPLFLTLPLLNLNQQTSHSRIELFSESVFIALQSSWIIIIRKKLLKIILFIDNVIKRVNLILYKSLVSSYLIEFSFDKYIIFARRRKYYLCISNTCFHPSNFNKALHAIQPFLPRNVILVISCHRRE